MSNALYRKYRSKSLDTIIGQKHITDTLARALKSGRVSHAYLFTGPRGVGKTSVARILAHAINKIDYLEGTSHLDIIEIDAASNNSVEDVRDLREKASIAPALLAKKIYIIDEVHMLSKSAFNALLKTLEEPPSHVVFILATTNIEKLPETIVSRTQRYSFRPITISDSVEHLRYIADQEKITIDTKALELIAEQGDGSFRDSISLLDQLANSIDSSQTITTELIEVSLGLAPTKLIDDIVSAIDANDIEKLLISLKNATASNLEAHLLAGQLMKTLSKSIAKKPHYIELIDKLLDVSASSRPDIKLLTVLARAITPSTKPVAKSAALLSTRPSITMPVAEIASVKPPKVAANQTVEHKTPKQDFDWDKLLGMIKQKSVALSSILERCKCNASDSQVVIYAGSSFYKNKLSDSKYLQILHDSMSELGFHGLEILIEPTKMPPTDSVAASITAIMGGGEEITLETA
jgi:DNA polymerase III subunit gamma/tau